MTINKAFSADVKANDGERAVTARITTTAVDRDGEVVVSQGVNAKSYEANPVVMLDHLYTGKLPVGRVAALKRNDTDLIAKVVFAERPDSHPADSEWIPDTIFSLYQQGVLNAFSIGFIPVEQRAATDYDRKKYGENCERVFSKTELLELSVTAIPANQEAVTLAVSKGMCSADLATKAFGYIAKSPADDAKPEMVTCSVCHKDYPDDEMTESMDGKPVCKACMSDMDGDEPKPAKRFVEEVEVAPNAAPLATKHILEEMEVTEPVSEHKHVVVCAVDAPAPVEHKMRVHHVIHETPRPKANVHKLVVCQINKQRGRLSQN